MAHGTDEQRAQWLPRILGGDDVWCQLFSEPGAGSDLAALTTRAENRAAHIASPDRRCGRRTRRSPTWRSRSCAPTRRAEAPRHLDAGDPDGRARGRGAPAPPDHRRYEFNEVFLDDVVVPISNLIGPEHGGWRVANTTLANERGASFIWREQVLHECALRDLAAERRGPGRRWRCVGAPATCAVVDRRRAVPAATTPARSTASSGATRSARSRAS